jgi:hypothetical protein
MAGALLALGGCEREFGPKDIINMENEITAKAIAEGFQVTGISMIRESGKKATGFASLTKAIEGYGVVNVQWNCEATMESGSEGRYIWRCAP